HVDRDAVALLDAELLQSVRGAGRHAEEVLVGDRPAVPGLPLPVVADLGTLVRRYMTIESVLRDVQLAAQEPFGVGRLPLEHLGKGLAPRQGLRVLGPETLEVLLGPLVDRRVLGVRLGRECLRRRKGPVLTGERLERRRRLGFRDQSGLSKGRSAGPGRAPKDVLGSALAA